MNAIRVAGVVAALATTAASARHGGGGKPPVAVNEVFTGTATRDHTVNEITPVAGMEVAVAPAGVAAWRVSLKNNNPAAISIVWDESSFVSSTGVAGRLIRGETRTLDSANPQPPSPVPPGSSYVGILLAEKLMDEEEAEAKYGNKYLSTGAAQIFLDHRKKRDAYIVGGKINLVVSADDGKKTWTGAVVPSKPTAQR